MPRGTDPRLASLAWKVALAQGLVLSAGYLAARQAGPLPPAQAGAILAGLAAIWLVDCLAIALGGPILVRPLARALAAPRPLSPAVAGRAAAVAVSLPGVCGRTLFAIGIAGCAVAQGVTLARVGLHLDLALAALGIMVATSLLGAMIAFACCARATAELAVRLEVHEPPPSRGTIRGRILWLGVGLSVIAVLLVGSAGTIRQGGVVAADMTAAAVGPRTAPFAWSMLVAVLITLAASAALAWLTADAIAIPIRALGSAADRMASGDLTGPPSPVSADEMGALAVQFQRMAQGLTGLVREVQSAAQHVSTGALEAGSIGEQVRRGALEQHEGVRAVQRAVEDMESSMAMVSGGLVGLSDYVSGTSRSVGEMAQTFDAVQRKASELERSMATALGDVEGLGEAGRDAEGRLAALQTLAARSGASLSDVKASVGGLERAATESEATAAAVADMADRAGAVVEGTVHGIETLRGAVADAHQRIAALGQRSDDIDQVVDFISEVAGRTSLLSLNASIIAAQAGEHGKAFAVVADQIRDLAAQIARSTTSIGDIIRAVREDVEGTASLIDRGDALAAEGVQLARNSLGALAEIRRSTARGRETAAAIREAVRAHARSSNDLADLVELVTEGSRAVGDAVQLVGRSVSGVHAISRGVTSMADGVARTLEEQAGMGKRQLENLSRLETMIQEISRAVDSHAAATEAVKRALQALSHAAGQHESAVHGLSGISGQIGSSARALAERVNRFKV